MTLASPLAPSQGSVVPFTEAVGLVVRALEQALGGSAVWIGHLDEDRGVLRVLAAGGDPSLGLEAGMEAPLEATFCHVLACGGATIANDVPTDERYAVLPLAATLGIGSFAGAVMHLADGTPVGTVCAFHRDRGAYDARTGALLQAFAALVARDIEHQRRGVDLESVIEDLRRQAATDALTGLANRRAFHVALEAAWAAHRGTATVALVDVDRFKAVNDVHGHQVGDAVLVALARALQEASGPGAVVGRLGGDEFAVVLDGADLEAWEAEVHACVRRAVRDVGVPVRVSVGSCALAGAHAPEDALASADAAMYRRKRRGARLFARA